MAASPRVFTRAIAIDSFELLRAATPTSRAEIIQMEAGPMRGRLQHAVVADLSLGFGSFSRGLISKGVFSHDRVTIGFMFERQTERPREARLEGVQIWSPGVEHERRHFGGGSFGALSVLPDDMLRFFGPDSRFSDPFFWLKTNAFRADPLTGSTSANALRGIMTGFERRSSKITARHAEFWKRAILEAATAAIADMPSPEFVPSPVRLVRRAQELIEQPGSEPLHLSELTTALRVSRRSLQRAFDEVLGTSPISYLRHRRLCEARIQLRQSGGGETIADVAFAHGFSDFGRFSRYYRELFGEYPSDTVALSR